MCLTRYPLATIGQKLVRAQANASPCEISYLLNSIPDNSLWGAREIAPKPPAIRVKCILTEHSLNLYRRKADGDGISTSWYSGVHPTLALRELLYSGAKVHFGLGFPEPLSRLQRRHSWRMLPKTGQFSPRSRFVLLFCLRFSFIRLYALGFCLNVQNFG